MQNYCSYSRNFCLEKVIARARAYGNHRYHFSYKKLFGVGKIFIQRKLKSKEIAMDSEESEVEEKVGKEKEEEGEGVGRGK